MPRKESSPKKLTWVKAERDLLPREFNKSKIPPPTNFYNPSVKLSKKGSGRKGISKVQTKFVPAGTMSPKTRRKRRELEEYTSGYHSEEDYKLPDDEYHITVRSGTPDERLVAHARTYDHLDEKRVHIGELGVHQSFQRKGLGSHLAKIIAQERAKKGLFSAIIPISHASRMAYLKAGFKDLSISRLRDLEEHGVEEGTLVYNDSVIRK